MLLRTAVVAAALAGPVESAHLGDLVRKLGSPSFAERDSASRQLERVGEPALDALAKGLATTDDPEVRRRAGAVADRIERGQVTEVARVKGFRDIVWAVAVSPDGKLAAAGGGGDNVGGRWLPGGDFAVRVFDPQTGKVIHTLPSKTPVSALAFAPDGTLYAAAASFVHRWDAAAGKPLDSWHVGGNGCQHLAASPDGKQVLIGGWNGSVRLLSAADGTEVRAFPGHEMRVWDVAFAPDGKRVASCGDEHFARLWDVATGKEQRRLTAHANCVVRVAFSADGKRVVTGGWDHRAVVWDAATGEPLRVLEHAGRVEGVAFTPDGTRVVTGSLDKTVRVWDAATGEERARFAHDGPVAKVAVSPDGRFAVSAGWDKTARVWRLPRR